MLHHPERFTADSLVMLVALVTIGESRPIYDSAGDQAPRVVGHVYRAPHAWYVAGPEFNYPSRSLGLVCLHMGFELYNLGHSEQRHISCHPTAELAAARLSILILGAVPVAEAA